MTPSRVLALLLAGSVVRAVAGGSAEYLAPVWTWQVPGRVEWLASVECSERAYILVATSAGGLCLLDADTGHPLMAAPIAARPGVRLVAGTGDGTAYCFDRQAVYALDSAKNPLLRWCFGQPQAGGAELAGDPETLTGWIQAARTQEGLAVLNRDGRVVWLNAADGRPRWELSLGPMPVTARLFVSDNRAAVHWASGGHVRAAFFELTETPPTLRIVDLDSDWPLWSTLTRGGLCMVWAERAALWTATGLARETALELPAVSAAALGVDERVGLNTEQGERLWLLVGAGTRPVAYDLLAGRRLWGRADPGSPRLSIEALTCARGRVVATNNFGPVVFDSCTGRVLGACRRVAPNRLLGWHLGDHELYALYISPGIYVPTLELVCVGLRPGEQDVGGPRSLPRSWTLAPTGYVSQAVWDNTHLVTLEIDTLRAYTLP
jgi:outer membrane protein assembly factor BamB